MTEKNKINLNPFKHRRLPVEHWRDSREMHRVMHSLNDAIKAVLLELLDQPMTRKEIRECLQRMALSGSRNRRLETAQLNLTQDLDQAQASGVLEENNSTYILTPAGREMAEHMQAVIPLFMGWIFSAETVSFLSIIAHFLLSVFKLIFGYLSYSAGLIADGVDNSVDTVSAVLVWVGIRFKREKLVSVFILLTMFASVVGVGLAAYYKMIDPKPISDGLVAFVVSAMCGLIMLGLSAYQYLAGKKRGNLAILCQAVDSRNHFWMSLLVCGGIFLSLLGSSWPWPWLHYGDAIASMVIGILILRGAIELAQELFKSADEPAEVSHFMKHAIENKKEKIIFGWLRGQLGQAPLTLHELEKRFAIDFFEQAPKIYMLADVGFQPESALELHQYLDRFEKRRKILIDDGRYWLVSH